MNESIKNRKKNFMRDELFNAISKVVNERKNQISENYVIKYNEIEISELFEENKIITISGYPIISILEPRQGVTWGGEKCESIFIVNQSTTNNLEKKLIYKIIGGEDIKRDKIEWKGNYAIFPYIESQNKWIPAFRNLSGVQDFDSLNFSLVLQGEIQSNTKEEKFLNRKARNIIQYPKNAEYLFQFYDVLSKREFKEKKITGYKKEWYEYIWPRDPKILKLPKIVCPRVSKQPRFVIDNKGYMPRDSVIVFHPQNRFTELKTEIEKLLKCKLSDSQILEYLKELLNSSVFKKVLLSQRAKKRGGYPQLNERTLSKFIVPIPNKRNIEIIKKIINNKHTDEDIVTMYA